MSRSSRSSVPLPGEYRLIREAGHHVDDGGHDEDAHALTPARTADELFETFRTVYQAFGRTRQRRGSDW